MKENNIFLHLGVDYLIPAKDVVLIGNFDSTNKSEITKEFFNIADEEGFIVDYSEGNPKSFVLTGETIFLSMISSKTLAKRLKNIPGEDIYNQDNKDGGV